MEECRKCMKSWAHLGWGTGRRKVRPQQELAWLWLAQPPPCSKALPTYHAPGFICGSAPDVWALFRDPITGSYLLCNLRQVTSLLWFSGAPSLTGGGWWFSTLSRNQSHPENVLKCRRPWPTLGILDSDHVGRSWARPLYFYQGPRERIKTTELGDLKVPCGSDQVHISEVPRREQN